MPPRLARLVAVVGAIALVALAFVVRGALAGDDPRDETTSGPEVIDGGVGEGDFDVLCDADLGAACDALRDRPGVREVEVMTGPEVLAAYAEEPPPFDAWLTLDPLPAMLSVAQGATLDEVAVVDEAAIPVATAALSLYAYEGRVDCADGELECVVDAGASAAVGVPARTTSAGLVVQAGLTGGVVPALADDGVAAIDDTDLGRLQGVLDERRPASLPDQRTRFLTARGTFDAIVTLTALAEPREGIVSVPLDPAITVGVVLTSFGGPDGVVVDQLSDAVLGETVVEALAQAGFAGVDGSSDGIPDADIVYALREELG